MDIIEFVEMIKERPLIHIGEWNFNYLNHYISGFLAHAFIEDKKNISDEKFKSEFTDYTIEYIFDKYKDSPLLSKIDKRCSKGYDYFISCVESDERNKIALFFEIFNCFFVSEINDNNFTKEKAKRIYKYYHCNTFHMSRDGYMDKWNEFNIPNAEIEKWTLEFINESINKADNKMKNFQPWSLAYLYPIKDIINKINDLGIYQSLSKLIIEYQSNYCSISELPHVINALIGTNQTLSDGLIMISQQKKFYDISNVFYDIAVKLIDKYNFSNDVYKDKINELKHLLKK